MTLEFLRLSAVASLKIAGIMTGFASIIMIAAGVFASFQPTLTLSPVTAVKLAASFFIFVGVAMFCLIVGSQILFGRK